ncbi:FKBP-type peptidyl-prolyl cis-trans isomerase [Agathobacter sp.]|nr:FKBP-type peptidyl-prolyl cis-trans isomerase [Agathobacter sp.]
MDGFEEGVVGHKVGETFDLNLKFPDDYKANTELAGKDVTFEVTLNGVYK